MDIKIAWYEKLQKWIRTLGIYEEMQKDRPRDMELMIGPSSLLFHSNNFSFFTLKR